MKKHLLFLVFLGMTICMAFGDKSNSKPVEDRNDLEEEGMQNDNGELMDTAETMVFRPHFKYKKQRIEKKRIHYQQPVNPRLDHDKSPPPVLVYDKKTGSYYPVHNPYHGYSGH